MHLKREVTHRLVQLCAAISTMAELLLQCTDQNLLEALTNFTATDSIVLLLLFFNLLSSLSSSSSSSLFGENICKCTYASQTLVRAHRCTRARTQIGPVHRTDCCKPTRQVAAPQGTTHRCWVQEPRDRTVGNCGLLAQSCLIKISYYQTHQHYWPTDNFTVAYTRYSA